MKNVKPVINSYLRCLEHEAFFDHFYTQFFASDTDIEELFFFVDIEKQMKLIRTGMMSILTFLDDGNVGGKVTIRRLKETHGKNGMDIPTQYYHIWKTCLLNTISHFDQDMNDELMSYWDQILSRGIQMMQEKPVEASN